VWEDHFLPEIIDPVSGVPLPDGEVGELVFTTLTKEALPVIRYRTHDLTSLLPGTARPGMRRMNRVSGRDDDMIDLRGVNVFPGQIEAIALQIPQLSPHFDLQLTRPRRLDELTVRIEARTGVSTVDGEQAARELARQIKTQIGCTVLVSLVASGTIERSTGKMKRLYDLRDK
jgi:phenylacetate-CoA ligase